MTLDQFLETLQTIGIEYRNANDIEFITAEEDILSHALVYLSLDTNLSKPAQVAQLLQDLEILFIGTDQFFEPALLVPVFEALTKAFNGFLANPDYGAHQHLLANADGSMSIDITLPEFIGLLKQDVIRFYQARIHDNELNPKHKSTANFEIQDSIAADQNHLHDLNIVYKKPQDDNNITLKHQKAWISKICADKTTAMREVIAQEFYRFMLPNHPKTRLSRDADGRIYVLSQKIDGAVSLQDLADKNKTKLHKDINAGGMKGLGSIMIMNLLMDETDAKLGNILFNPRTKEAIKIDGDWCYSHLRAPNMFANIPISEYDVANLPLIRDFKPNNWLDIRTGGETHYTREQSMQKALIENDFPDNQHFRREVNETMLKVLMLPPELLTKFMHCYTNDNHEVATLNKAQATRIEQLRTIALHDKSFQAYLRSDAAAAHLNKSIREMTEFKTMGKRQVINDQNFDVISKMHANVKKLHNADFNPVVKTEIKSIKLPPVKVPAPAPVQSASKNDKTFMPREDKSASYKLAPLVKPIVTHQTREKRIPVIGEEKKSVQQSDLPPVIMSRGRKV